MPEKKFSKLHFFRQKLSATSWLPLGGRLRLKVGGEEKLAFLFCLKICLLRNFQTKGRNLFSISISLSDNVPAPCFSEISSEIFGKSKMCYAPHSLRFRSAPSPQGEGFFIASFQGFPFLASPSGKLSTKLTEEVLSSIGKTSLTLDFATLLAEIAFKRQFGKVFPKGESKNYRLISWLPLA